ncbi:MAG: glycosyltransferase [Actinomycetota bacterium]|nr:MAG: glycosyltransferase [Actinomycetota bacterium]
MTARIRHARRIAAAGRRGLRVARSARPGQRDALVASGLVDLDWCEAVTGIAQPHARAAATAAVHASTREYLLRGDFPASSVSPLFVPAWCSRAAGREPRPPDPTVRYVTTGGFLVRPNPGPSPLFSDVEFLRTRAGTPVPPLARFLHEAAADPSVPLPLSWQAPGPATWPAVRTAMIAAARQRRTDAGLTAERVATTYDEDLAATTVARALARPLPPPGDRPWVSIVMPVRNRPVQVAEAIASIQAQTLPDWELVVVDDGSTDTTADVVAGIAATDPRIRLARTAGGGVSAARNAGLVSARGRYVAFLDSDNTWRPQFLQVMLTTMETDGLGVAYSGVRMHGPAGIRYRFFTGGLDHLLVRNHVDLNALVVRADVLAATGGDFDESLRRCVDHDLVIRLARQQQPVLVPFVGVEYAEDGADRITGRETFGWLWTVLGKHLIDWAALRSGVLQRVAGRVSVLAPSIPDVRVTLRNLRALLDTLPPTADAEIVVVDNGSEPALAGQLAGMAAADPRIVLVSRPVNGHFALGVDLALAASTGEYVVAVRGDVEVAPGWWPPLLDALADPAVVAAQALLCDADGTVAAAGFAFTGPDRLPVPILAGHATADVGANVVEVPALAAGVIAMRAADLVAVDGLEPRFTGGWEDVDLSLRIRRRWPDRRLVVVPAAVANRDDGARQAGGYGHPEATRVLLDRHGPALPDFDPAPWQRAGFTATCEAGVVRVDRAVRRTPAVAAASRPSLRWAIKIAAPAGPGGDSWGDTYFAAHLADALRDLGQDVIVDRRQSFDRESGQHDDVVLVIRGLVRYRPKPGQLSLLWVISHPDLVQRSELREYDHVFAASLPWARRTAGTVAVPVEALLQATDPDRFHPGLAAPDSGDAVLFVGDSRDQDRRIIADAVAAGVDLSVYGPNWGGRLDPRWWKAPYLDNAALGAAYRAAGVVLNDHWEDMAREGFLSNRLFDATAAGGRVISDPVDGIDEVFDGLVRGYRSPAELAAWAADPAAAFPSEARVQQISRRIRAEHSFAARAARLLDVATALWDKRSV